MPQKWDLSKTTNTIKEVLLVQLITPIPLFHKLQQLEERPSILVTIKKLSNRGSGIN